MNIFKIILLSLFILLFGTKTFAQIQMKPSSIYTGVMGLNNLNFSIPVGCEWQYKQFSFEVAPVFVLMQGLGSVTIIPDWQRFDFDLGIKYHFGKGIFTGLNYGYVDGPLYYKNTDNDKGGKLRGFTWSLGYRHTISGTFYASAFAGLTFRHGYEQYEYRFFGSSPAESTSFRIGLTIGYKLLNRQNETKQTVRKHKNDMN